MPYAKQVRPEQPKVKNTTVLLSPLETPSKFDVCDFVAKSIAEAGEAEVRDCEARSWVNPKDGTLYYAASFDQPSLLNDWDVHWNVPRPGSILSISPEGRISTFGQKVGVTRCYSIEYTELSTDEGEIRLIVDARPAVRACKAR